MAEATQFAGGATGLGGTVAARQFLDTPGRNRFVQPSALYGVGTGLLAGALWFTGADSITGLPDSFWGSHAITSIPAGVFSVIFPTRAGQSTASQVRETLSGRLPGDLLSGGNGMQTQNRTTQNADTEREQLRRGESRRREPSA
jgi:hypothetical protein